MKFVVLVAALLVVERIYAENVPFEDCGSGNIQRVSVEPCPTIPCVLKQGTTVKIRAQFIGSHPAAVLIPVIKGQIAGRREVTFPEPRHDACAQGKIKPSCPIRAGRLYTYATDFEIKPYYPAVASVMVTYSGIDPSGKLVACARVNSTIVKNPDLKSTDFF